MSSKAKLLRKKLKEQKEAKEAAKPKEETKKEGENPTGAKPQISIKSLIQNDQPKKEEKKKEEVIDPLNFFNQEHHEIKPLTGDKELNALLGIIEEDDKKVEEKKKADKDDEESGSSSESDDDGITEEQRLMNKKLAQQKLFSNRENRVSPTNNLFKPKPIISENMTKETIMEKFGDDFDGAVELPELNEQKKQIMLKKMRKTINKLSSLRIQKHMDSELRHMIEDKIEDLKKIKGVNYAKIEGTVQELILSLKQPDFYFADDEDVHQITDVQEPYDIKPKTDIDFVFFMKQTPKTN